MKTVFLTTEKLEPPKNMTCLVCDSNKFKDSIFGGYCYNNVMYSP